MLWQHALADGVATCVALLFLVDALYVQYQWVSKLVSIIQVIMTRLGYTQESAATVSEHTMQQATRACLLACACLHSAKPKAICHCDIRFANVLWDPEPFLADLEFAHFSPWQVIRLHAWYVGASR